MSTSTSEIHEMNRAWAGVMVRARSVGGRFGMGRL
jgi:hypothetical protein